MLINKDYENSHPVRITFHESTGQIGPLLCRAGNDDYVWKGSVSVVSGKKEGYADPDGPALTSTLNGGEGRNMRCRVLRSRFCVRK